MIFTLKNAIKLLENEISWCRDNPDKLMSMEAQNSFIKGIKQAQRLLIGAEKSVSDTWDSLRMDNDDNEPNQAYGADE